MLARMLEFGLVLLWTLGFITYSSAINVVCGRENRITVNSADFS